MSAGARSRVYSTEAITLRRLDFGEADRVLTVITPFRGKLRLLAKGARRPTSRIAGHVEPFSLAHLQVTRGRDLDLVTQATTIEPFSFVRSDLVRAAHAFHLAELVDGFLQEGDPHPEVFELFRCALVHLSGDRVAPALAARYFEVQLLAETGFQPELRACVRCGAQIEPVTNGYCLSLGGVLCPACTPLLTDAFPLQPDALKLLRFLQRTPPSRFHPLAVQSRVMAEAERVLRQTLEHALERRLRATDFVRRAVGATATRTASP